MLQQVAVVLMATLPLVVLRFAADPYQPGRGLVLGIAGLLAVAGATGIGVPRSREARAALLALVLAMLLIIAAAVAGGPASAVFGVHGRCQGLASGLAALVAFGVGLTSARHMRTFARAIALVLVLQSVVVFSQVLQGALPTGTIGNQVLAGGWLAIAVAVVIAATRAERRPVSAALWVAGAIGALALGAVGSRGAWVGVVAGLTVAVLAARSTRVRVATVALVVFVIVGTLAGGGASLAKLDPGSLDEGSAASRFHIWRGTASMIADHPLLGVGTGRFLYVFPTYQPVGHAQAEPGVRADQAHGLPLHTAAESGIPAALAACAFVALSLAAGLTRVRQGDAAALIATAGLAAWAAQALFGISTIESDGLAFMFAGVLLARSGTAPMPRSGRFALGAAAAVLVAACAWYVSADALHLRGLDAFYAGEMQSAWDLETAATRRNPLVDSYRVGAADAAAYGAASDAAALETLETGIGLEPMSYDLLLARARLLRSSGTPAMGILAAYRAAYESYPLGMTVGHETIAAALSAGDTAVAREIALRLLAAYPDDALSLSVVEEGGR